MYLVGLSTFSSCSFSGNTASYGDGGAVSVLTSTFLACGFTGNSAGQEGGAVVARGDVVFDKVRPRSCPVVDEVPTPGKVAWELNPHVWVCTPAVVCCCTHLTSFIGINSVVMPTKKRPQLS